MAEQMHLYRGHHAQWPLEAGESVQPESPVYLDLVAWLASKPQKSSLNDMCTHFYTCLSRMLGIRTWVLMLVLQASYSAPLLIIFFGVSP